MCLIIAHINKWVKMSEAVEDFVKNKQTLFRYFYI